MFNIPSRVPIPTRRPEEMQGMPMPQQMPQQVPSQVMQQAQGPGFMGRLRNNSDLLLALGAGLIGGQTGQEQAAMGFGNAAQALQGRKQQEQQNKTLQYLRQSFPEVAQMVDAGMPVADAFKMVQEQRKGADPTSGMREYELARQQGFGGSFLDYQSALKRAGATSVNVGQSEFGTIPQGYEMFTDPQSGARSMRPIAGGPVAQEEAAKQQQQQTAMQSYEQKFATVDNAITQVLEDVGPLTAGPGGAILGAIPGTSAYDMQATIDTIKANLGFEELQAMRDNSPTGGALGQVTERELQFLQSAQGNLDRAQSPEQLKAVLQDIQTRRREFADARRRAYQIDYGQPMPQAPAADMSLDELLDMYGN